MKRNSILLGILAALLIFTYFYEELGSKKERAESERRSELFSKSEFGDLQRIILPNASIEFASETDDILIGPEKIRGDYTKVTKLIDILSSLKIEKNLPLEEIKTPAQKEVFFGPSPLSLSFIFSEGSIDFTLGKKSDVSESFYVLVKTPKDSKFTLVKDASAREGIYWKQEHNSARSFLRLSEWLQKDNSFFYNLSLVRSKLSLKRVEVSNLRNRPFVLKYSQNQTEPAPPPGIEVSTTALKAYEQMLSQMKGVRALTLKAPQELEEPLATMVLENNQNERAIWEIYRRYQNKLGPFLLMKGDRLLYQMGSNELRAFFSNVQEFWDLRPLKGEEEGQVVTLKIGEKSERVRFPRELKPYFFTQAERISVRSVDDNVWASHFKELLQLDFEGITFSAKLFERELMIENLKTGIRYYYRVGEKAPFPLSLEAYLSSANK